MQELFTPNYEKFFALIVSELDRHSLFAGRLVTKHWNLMCNRELDKDLKVIQKGLIWIRNVQEFYKQNLNEANDKLLLAIEQQSAIVMKYFLQKLDKINKAYWNSHPTDFNFRYQKNRIYRCLEKISALSNIILDINQKINKKISPCLQNITVMCTVNLDHQFKLFFNFWRLKNVVIEILNYDEEICLENAKLENVKINTVCLLRSYGSDQEDDEQNLPHKKRKTF